MTDETITLDPVEFAPTRVELGLDELGLRVREADWGDSAHELFLIKQLEGEIPADVHPPNRQVNIKIMVKKEHPVSLAEAAERLQAKLGIIQREQGFVRRDLDSASGFSESVGFQVFMAGFGGLHGWMMAHRKKAPDVNLVLTTGPYCYGVKETETAEYKGEGNAGLQYVINNIRGTAPGLIRIRCKNTGAVRWRGLMNAIESRYYSADEKAKPFWEAESLELLGNAAKATREGGSPGGANNVVKSGALSSMFSPVLGSGAMTHQGPRRMIFRIYDPNTSAGNIKLKILWRPLGSSRWIENKLVSTPLSKGFAIVDLGEVRPEPAVMGEERWEWRLYACTKGTIGEEVEIDCWWPMSTEQHMKVVASSDAGTEGTPIYEDNFIQTPGNATGKEALIGGKYTSPGIDADDFKISEGKFGWMERAAVSDAATNSGRILLYGGLEEAYVRFKATVFQGGLETGRYGLLLRYSESGDKKNYLRVAFTTTKVHIGGPNYIYYETVIIEKCVADIVTVLKEYKMPSSDSKLDVTVTTTGKVIVLAKTKNVWVEITTEDEVLATGKALAKGKIGFYDGHPTATAAIRYYGEASATKASETEAADIDAVAYPERKVDLRTDGVHRQHLTADVWARMIPEGFLPYSPPSGLEGRAARGLLLPSQGDFGSNPDAGSNKYEVQVFYFPGYHFTSEAV